jgi:hypothetical protein
MLRSAKGRSADAAFGVQDTLIEALVRKDTLAADRLIEIAQGLVNDAAIDDANIVSEVAGSVRDEMDCSAGVLLKRQFFSVISPMVLSAVRSVRARLGAIPEARAIPESVSAPDAIFVNRSNSTAANKAFGQ